MDFPEPPADKDGTVGAALPRTQWKREPLSEATQGQQVKRLLVEVKQGQ